MGAVYSWALRASSCGLPASILAVAAIWLGSRAAIVFLGYRSAPAAARGLATAATTLKRHCPLGPDNIATRERVVQTIDEALGELRDCGPEFGGNGLSNHGPMAAEALFALGRPEAVQPWVARYRKRLGERPPEVEPVLTAAWQTALGDVRRVSDWEAFFTRELEEQPWPAALEVWVRRLAPGLMAAATHGLIRTAHAVRSLTAADTPERRRELVAGLAYWAARYQTLPGVPGPASPRPPSQAIKDLPIMPLHLRSRAPTSIFQAVAELDGFPPFSAAVDLAAPGADLSAFLCDLTATMARRYLENAGPASIPYVHTVTAPSALRMLLPFLTRETATQAVRYAWQAAAAIHSRAHYPRPVSLPDPLPEREDLIDRAIASGDEHAIKFTEACLREHALAPHPAFLAGPLDMSGRYGRRTTAQT
jgi:hypothetical protein